MAKVQRRGRRVRFTVMISDATFQILENQQGDRTWRQLAQKAIADYAATLQASAPAAEAVSAQ